MTSESINAIKASYQFECKKDALRQVQDGGVKVTFNINPDDMPNGLYSDPMGQRYMCVIVPVGDDETPIVKPKGVSKAGEGKLLVQDPMLGMFLRDGYLEKLKIYEWDTENTMKDILEISSCSELIEGGEIYERFRIFRSAFYAWKQFQHQQEYYTE